MRGRFLVIGAVVAAVSVVAPPGVRAEPFSLPMPSALTAEPFSAGAFKVTVDANRDSLGVARICIEASAVTEDGPEFQTVVREWSCSTRRLTAAPPSYRFAPVRWVAEISGRVGTMRITDRRRLEADRDWVSVSRTTDYSTATLDLRWVGRGERQRHATVSGFPGSCYTLPPICTDAAVGVTRRAVVRGSIAFHGIGVKAFVPVGHAGTMIAGR